MKVRFQSASLALFIMTGLLFGGMPACRAADSAEGGIKWASYEQGLAQAKQEQKKVYLYFYTDWCGYCKKMVADTFLNKKVIALLNKEFIPIQINSDKARDVAAKYKIRPVPASVFLEADGQTIGSRPGYLQPDVFLRMLEFVKAEGYKP